MPTDTERLLAEWLDGDDGRWYDVFGLWVQGKRDTEWVARKIADAHLPPGLIIATVDGLAKEIPEKIGWLCESDEQWAANARVIGARLVCIHPAYAPTTDPDMPWLSECRCVKCGSKRPAAIEHGRQGHE